MEGARFIEGARCTVDGTFVVVGGGAGTVGVTAGTTGVKLSGGDAEEEDEDDGMEFLLGLSGAI